MAIRNYEGMFLMDSGRFASNSEAMTEELLAILERINAEIVAHRPWQDGKLAYPINGHRKGLHYLVYFRADSGQMDELNRLVRLNTRILRHLVIEPPTRLYDVMSNALANPQASNDSSYDDSDADSADAEEPVEQEA